MSDGDDFGAWREANREFLALAIDALRLRMDATVGEEPTGAAEEAELAAAQYAEQMSFPPALDRVAEAFELGAFERNVVLACAAYEVDPGFGGDARALTVGQALQLLPDAHWSAFDRSEPLRRWGVIEIDAKPPFVNAGVRLAADVTGYVIGFSVDPSPEAPFDFVVPPSVALPSKAKAAAHLAQAVAHATGVKGQIPIVELHGASGEERTVIAALLSGALGGAALHRVDARDLPPAGDDLEAAVARWNRFSRLANAHLLVTLEPDAAGDRVMRRLEARAEGPVLVSTARAREAPGERQLIRHRMVESTVEERLELWGAIIGGCLERLGLEPDVELDAEVLDLAARFRLTEPVIESICLAAEALAESAETSLVTAMLAGLLRDGCRGIVRSRLDGVADFVTVEGDEVVVLPEPEHEQLGELIGQIRLAPHLQAPGGRRQGVVALFSGPSGTGKTHAARVVARATGLDLYRVDVSSVLSKYIGETEQNLEEVFTAASLGGVILLFDEADALFGKRSEVKDSHDRYANIGTSYLLQRIERAPAPVILTTNLKDALDAAFTRRIQIMVEFPFPTEGARRDIWRAVFPSAIDTSALDPTELTELGATGGTIQNIARRATFMAAAERSQVTMDHVRESARRDARQSGRELAEVESW